jgi:hypothetical protein
MRSEDGEISGHQTIKEHVYQFYIGLMGSEEPKFLGLGHNSWPVEERVFAEKNEKS